MEATNAAGASTRKLFDFVKQNRLDPVAILESRRKDIEAIASVNATLLAACNRWCASRPSS